MPSGWLHEVINLEDTLSVNHNWINHANIAWTVELVLNSHREARGGSIIVLIFLPVGVNHQAFPNALHNGRALQRLGKSWRKAETSKRATLPNLSRKSASRDAA